MDVIEDEDTRVAPCAVPPPEKGHRTVPEWTRGLLAAVGIFLASRVVILLALAFGTFIHPEVTVKSELQTWDAAWYMAIVTNGYPRQPPSTDGVLHQSTIAFFPLFPVVARAVDRLTPLSPLGAAVGVSIASGAAAVAAIWLLVRRLSGAAAAGRATTLFSFFPASMALFLPYPEGMAIALAAACLLCLLQRRWLWAGLAAGLATAARPTAIVLMACCAWAAFHAIRSRREWRSLVAVALAPTGMLAYFLFLWHHTGSFMRWFEVEREGWGQGTKLGQTLEAFEIVFRAPANDVNALVCSLTTVFVAVALVALARWRPPGVVVVYAVTMTILILTAGIASRPRYVLAVFPLISAIAVVARHPTSFAAVAALSGTLLGMYTLLSVLPAYAVF